jgi:hypothetical protein
MFLFWIVLLTLVALVIRKQKLDLVRLTQIKLRVEIVVTALDYQDNQDKKKVCKES